MDPMEDSILSGRKLLFHRSKKRGFDCLHKSEYTRAFAHFVIALTIDPDSEEMLNLLLYALSMLSNELEINENYDELIMCYEQALEVLPQNAQVLHGLATILFRLGHVESATKYFQMAFRENPFYAPSLYCIDNLKNALIERWHFTMLNDKKRNSAFAEAITRAVKEGYRCVLDIGAGTGILSMISADAGAEKVYGCEGSLVMFGIMQDVVNANKKDIKLLNKLSYDLMIPSDLPERVNLVVTETFDAGLFGENVLQTLSHAWDHLLMENESEGENNCSATEASDAVRLKSKVIPQSAVLWAVPIECLAVRKLLRANSEPLNAFDLLNVEIAASINHEEPYSTERLSSIEGGYTLLSTPQKITSVNFNSIEEIKKLSAGLSFRIDYTCITKGQVDAVAVWFDLNLDDSVKLSTQPGTEESCWEQALFYAYPKHFQGSSPFVDPGDSITLDFNCKGHLTLQKVTTSVTAELPKSLSIDSSIIQALNSLSSCGVLNLNLLPQVEPPKQLLVVDTSFSPVLGLKALKDGADRLVVLPSKNLLGVNQLQQLCSIKKERMKVMSYEDICLESVSCDVLITEPVEMCGLLKKNAFEDIALIRNFCTAKAPAVYPRQLGIFASLIESSSLCGLSKVTSDDNCMGYKISQFINTYQSNIHQDLQLSTLPHVKMCDVIKLCDIDLDQLLLERNKLQSFVEFHGSVNAKINRSGLITAIPYWFSLVYDCNTVLNTCHQDSVWRQAAVIPEKPINVSEGESVTVTWTCRNSCLHISVSQV